MIPTFQRLPGNTQASDGNYESNYEPERCRSMEKHLKKGDCLFDIGVSDGWISVIYAQFVGAENMCMFEPTWQVWPNIKGIWDANGLAQPRAAFYGFVSDKTQLIPPNATDNFQYKDGWPVAVYCTTLIEEMTFRSLISTGNNIPQTTIDDFVARTGNIPKGISIDVEGAEFLVLKGAKETLLKYHPLIWLSLHDINGCLTYDYGSSKEEVFQYLTDCGYKMEYLETYGDSHWLCS
jgi:FkbM family methyltransferase